MAGWPEWVVNPAIPPLWVSDSSAFNISRMLNPGWMRQAIGRRHALDRWHRTQWAVR